ncbi:MAG: hypothetical protein UT53_C0034G0001 [Candidatus Yanofskybacteria bacterium GW2011_GWD2_39_48]|uniref:Uncharacterized protein n=1 Tax=Candidatus Yanofskybacteria bacterium GW2011_GWD2_39_48 TaxID=1619031 RepID=A0A0G0P498_9BACT|nr:MAG: hypothetical protein UT53_C0034G0001 [Candidatus Yanofskybacteria bacterium GW2011_GWD2_39_48]
MSMLKDVVVCSHCGMSWDNKNGEVIAGENPMNVATLQQIIARNPQIVADLSRTNTICKTCRCEVVFPISVLINGSQ